jgi:hypothetical protein
MGDDFLQFKPGPFQQSTIEGGLPKLVRIWERLRDLNEGGYGSGRLVDMKNGPGKTSNKKTSCSPFTATSIYMALDPRAVDVSKPYALEEPYDPRFNGGEALDNFFYYMHNSFPVSEYKTERGAWKPGFKSRYVDRVPQLFKEWTWINHSAGSVVFHNLGYPVDDRQMRRGDVVGIDWMNKGGHAVFCWNVHLNKRGEVDCFQYVSANGGGGQGPGVTVIQYPVDKRYLDTSGGKYRKQPNKEMFVGILDEPKAYPEYVSAPYQWYALRHIEKKDIDTKSFGVPENQVVIVDWKFTWQGNKLGIDGVHVSRLFGVTPPEPWLKAGDETVPDEPAQPAKPKPVATVKSKPAEAQPKPEEKKEESKTAVPGEVQDHQHDVEVDLQILWTARWISVDPGDAKSVNDERSQAAIKDFQSKHMKDQKVPHAGHADPATRKRMSRFAAWATTMPIVNMSLRMLHEHGQLEHAPGDNTAQLDEGTLAALKEFQTKKHLDPDGIPGNMTQTALAAAVKGLGEKKPDAAPAPPAKSNEPAAIQLLYWVPNNGSAGQRATLKATATGSDGKSFRVCLFSDGKQLSEAGTMPISGGKGSLEVAIPIGLARDTQVEARLEGDGLKAATASKFIIGDADNRIAVMTGGDIFLDPPVRNLPQWDPKRWGPTRIAGKKDGAMIDWTNNGCNASTAAMILRWFAEDCKAGRVPFPTKESGTVDKTWYGPRMGEAMWPNADPPGKVELTEAGRIHFRKIYGIASHYLKTAGEIERNAEGLPLDKYKANHVTENPRLGWLQLIKEMLKNGPCIVGIGEPAKVGHFVVGHGVVGGALLVVDPGNVLYQAKHWNGYKHISDWSSRDGFLDATGGNAEKVRMPPASQWPGKKAPGMEGDERSYNLISGQFLAELLANLISVTSLTHPEGAKLGGGAPQQATPAEEKKPEKEKPKQEEKPKDDKPASKGKVKSGGVAVAGKPFADWFNDEFRPKHAGKHPTIQVKGKNLPEFPHKIDATNFKAFFNATKQLSGQDEISLLQFAAAFCIPYNETGGSFHPTIERGGKLVLPRGAEKDKHGKNLIDFGEVGYFFWGVENVKRSYNLAKSSWTWPAGDDLKKRGMLDDPNEIEVWNGRPSWNAGDPLNDPNYPKPLEDPRYPNPQTEPLKSAQRECHFYKFRGRGFTQTTGREGYIKYADPALTAAGYSKIDALSNDELDKAFSDPKVYVGVYHNELIAPPGPHKQDFAKIDEDEGKLVTIGDRLAGVGANYGEFYSWRCKTLAAAMEEAGWTGG